MELVNNFLTEQRLEGGEFVGLKRVFNNYTDEGYNWDAGGRMYDIDQNGYQKLSKEARSRMTINGEAAAEIDIEACFLSILCGLLKSRCHKHGYVRHRRHPQTVSEKLDDHFANEWKASHQMATIGAPGA